ncbi:MAG: manganese catalase family protein [Christensenellales bacterium]|jgi:spore coat protein JC
MWIYQKSLEYPVRITKPDPRMALLIITQYGGPDGESAASMRYLSQRFAMPTNESKAVLNDIGTEELAHFEMVGSMVRQLMKNATPEQIKAAGAGGYFADHGKGVWMGNAEGVPFTAAYFQSKDDVIANLHEDMAAEEKARATYEYLIRMADDPDVIDALRFLRMREVVHFQRFGETLVSVQAAMDEKKLY